MADTATPRRACARRRGPLSVWGPGLIVMLADTDAGSLVTAAQSGTEWGYAMVLPQLVLVPVLYVVQEITVRLGAVTGKGHGTLIRENFGWGWGALSAGTLVVSAAGALLTELAGIAGVGELFGVPRLVSVALATGALVSVAFTGGYRRAERLGIAVGVFELGFVPAMLLAHPHGHDLWHGLARLPLGHRSYLLLLTANVGAVIMPWMIFYQQTAVVAKGLGPGDLASERRDTAVGTLLSQGVMVTVVVTMAATVGRAHPGASLDTARDIARVLQPYLGAGRADVLVGAAVLGAALVAALVVSLAASWGLAEVIGWRHSLDEPLSRRTAPFYGTYAAVHVVGAVLVLASVDLVALAVDVEILNALMLPLVLGLLLVLEARALPDEHRLRGPHRWAVTGLAGLVIAFALASIPIALNLL